MRQAFDALAPLADGVQLTPGNHPTLGFAEHAARFAVRTHHGFAYERRVQPVWSETVECLVGSTSVHPPSSARIDFAAFAAAVDAGARVPVLETMYPGHLLGSEAELSWAMDRRLSLAVDVSHLFIQRCAGVLGDAALRRLLDYDCIDEIDVSHNDGRSDQHAALTDATFGLDWARARGREGTCVVLECYMHRMIDAERRRQVEHARGS